jgi:release factor glutamine methyltransferase
VTVLEIIQRTADFFSQKGIESPRLQAELLLAHVLKMPRLKLYLAFQRELTDAEVSAMRECVRRRGSREPLQHIVGTTSFCGLELECTKAALVPRPETELLAERAWQFAAARGADARVLDAGTGTGCIAIAVAAMAPDVRVAAVDLSAEALELARRNAERHGMSARIEFQLADIFRGEEGSQYAAAYDLVVSNPPYIPAAEIATLDPEVREFDPRVALDGGGDGLDCYRVLARKSPLWLRPGGKLMVEFGDGQDSTLKSLFENENWIVEEIVADYTARPRILIAHPRGQ